MRIGQKYLYFSLKIYAWAQAGCKKPADRCEAAALPAANHPLRCATVLRIGRGKAEN
jgi:hypothetical protein